MRLSFLFPPLCIAGDSKVAIIIARRLTNLGHTVNIVSLLLKAPSHCGKLRSFNRGGGWPENMDACNLHIDGTGLKHRALETRRPVMYEVIPDADVVAATWWETSKWVFALSQGIPTMVSGASAYYASKFSGPRSMQ
jgi:hypothetical protein